MPATCATAARFRPIPQSTGASPPAPPPCGERRNYRDKQAQSSAYIHWGARRKQQKRVYDNLIYSFFSSCHLFIPYLTGPLPCVCIHWMEPHNLLVPYLSALLPHFYSFIFYPFTPHFHLSTPLYTCLSSIFLPSPHRGGAGGEAGTCYGEALPHFTSHMSLVSSSSAKVWYGFCFFTSSICWCRASS